MKLITYLDIQSPFLREKDDEEEGDVSLCNMSTTENRIEGVGIGKLQRSALLQVVEATEDGFGVDNPVNILPSNSCEKLANFQS